MSYIGGEEIVFIQRVVIETAFAGDKSCPYKDKSCEGLTCMAYMSYVTKKDGTSKFGYCGMVREQTLT